MAFVDYCQEVLGEVVEQAEWTHPRLPPVEIAAVVFDAGAMAHFAQHLHIVGHALKQALRFEFLGFTHEVVVLFAEVELNLSDSGAHAFGRGDEEVCGINLEEVVSSE